jgi:chemotaxis protein MotB
MKRTFLKSALATIILAGAAMTGGCLVPKARLDQALAANHTMSVRLEDAKQALSEQKTENQRLTGQLDANQVKLKATADQLAKADTQNKYLETQFNELAAKYAKLAGDRPKLTPIGPILPSQVDEALRAFAKDNAELLEYLPKYGMVKLKADLTFKKGSDFVGEAAATAFHKFATIVNAPAAEGFNIYVAGHTDNIPIVKDETRRRHPNNWYLSVHRAVAVQEVLVKAGIAPQRVGAMGFGEHHPVAPNKAGRGGNETNRRVEIWIVPPSRYLTQPTAETD